MVHKIVRLVVVSLVFALGGCFAPAAYVQQADDAAYAIIAEKQDDSGVDSSFSILRPRQRLRQRLLLDQSLIAAPEPVDDIRAESASPFQLSLIDALQVAAHNSRAYQSNKESVFRRALALDLERDAFRSTFSGALSSMWSSDNGSGERLSGLTQGAQGGWERQFNSGVAFATSISLDLVQLLTANRVSARGVVADVSLTVPLLRGAGREIVTEPLQQAERDVLYAMWDFERYRRSFAVQVASEYLLVLERMNQVDTAYDNYLRLKASRQRARRLADAGRLPGIQVDQALQDELRARTRWVGSRQTSVDYLDRFKLTLGLPTDALIELDRSLLIELESKLTLTSAASAVDPPMQMLKTALATRRDLRVVQGRVQDCQRAIRVAEDALRGDVTLFASGSDGSARSVANADADDAHLDPDRGAYSALLSIDLPFERTAERNALRNCLIDYAESKRDREELEDSIKYQVRSAWRGWQEAFEVIQIESQALKVAQRRVSSTDLFLRAGRIQMRDLLEAQDDLVLAHNSLVAAQVQYRIKAMEYKRDLGTLFIDPAGAWLEDVVEHDSVEK
ncbi:MAG: TolC family protein [Thermodesulfobacteriota bacterium]|nr:TolC family protein [Thermodesulfobacteriota bacterium]